MEATPATTVQAVQLTTNFSITSSYPRKMKKAQYRKQAVPKASQQKIQTIEYNTELWRDVFCAPHYSLSYTYLLTHFLVMRSSEGNVGLFDMLDALIAIIIKEINY